MPDTRAEERVAKGGVARGAAECAASLDNADILLGR